MSDDFDAPTTAIEDLTGDYQLDPAHSRLGFIARHAMVTKVRGSFQEFTATVHLDAHDPSQSSAEIRIQAASLTTGQEQRDAHLRSPDFFDVEEHPEIVFTSTSARLVEEQTYELTGDLAIRDVTRPVTVSFEHTGSAKDPYGNMRAGFDGRATVNRKDWDLTWNATLETGGFLVSDKVQLEFDISAIKLSPTP